VTIFVVVGVGRPIWEDEAATIQISNQSFAGIVESLRHENNFPLYFFLLSVWIRAFGDSEIALRVLSATFYLGGGAAAFVLGRRVSSMRRGAWYSAFFYLCSPLAVVQAQNIRMYSLLGLLSALSTLVFIRLFFEPRRHARGVGACALTPYWPAFLLINALGILTHLWFAFLLASQLLALLVFDRSRLRACVAGMAVAGLPFLVLWIGPFRDQLHNGATNWMATYPARLLVLVPLEFYGLRNALMYYGMAAYSWAAASAAKRRPLLHPPMIPLLLLLFTASLAFPLLVSLARPIYYPGRYAVIALPPLAVLLATVLSTLFPRTLLALVCFSVLALTLVYHVVHRDQVPDFDLPAGQSDRTTARFLLQHAAPGDALVFTGLTRPAADYYLRRAGAAGRFVEVNFPKENDRHPGWADSAVAPDLRHALEAEAAATATHLQQIIAAGREVWLYDGSSVGELLKQKLDATLSPPQVHPLSGPSHRRVLEYSGPK
jgi:hypothetical protein